VTIAIRPMQPDDRAFVVSAWSSSLRMTRDVPFIPMSRWADVMRPIVEQLLDRPGPRTFIAHGSVLYGFITAEPGYVYYAYVAQPFRRQGICRALFAAAHIDPAARWGYACRTRASWEILVLPVLKGGASRAPLAFYDPYRARFDNERNDDGD
jgi:GNAT superfamily N-acetyltransferase